jgi:hypothetical protein
MEEKEIMTVKQVAEPRPFSHNVLCIFVKKFEEREYLYWLDC